MAALTYVASSATGAFGPGGVKQVAMQIGLGPLFVVLFFSQRSSLSSVVEGAADGAEATAASLSLTCDLAALCLDFLGSFATASAFRVPSSSNISASSAFQLAEA